MPPSRRATSSRSHSPSRAPSSRSSPSTAAGRSPFARTTTRYLDGTREAEAVAPTAKKKTTPSLAAKSACASTTRGSRWRTGRSPTTRPRPKGPRATPTRPRDGPRETPTLPSSTSASDSTDRTDLRRRREMMMMMMILTRITRRIPPPPTPRRRRRLWPTIMRPSRGHGRFVDRASGPTSGFFVRGAAGRSRASARPSSFGAHSHVPSPSVSTRPASRTSSLCSRGDPTKGSTTPTPGSGRGSSEKTPTNDDGAYSPLAGRRNG
mmetsp:Transcript_5128/g.16799  ORF Transcript_5128/g.16799 Transcript_5128/m.16799 type:complete len:265 (-) Transcript_5128:185-979(-)